MYLKTLVCWQKKKKNEGIIISLDNTNVKLATISINLLSSSFDEWKGPKIRVLFN